MSQILFVLTGSIACYKACDAISRLVQRGHRVRAVATEAAQRFVGVATLEGLTGQKVSTDLFAAGEALDHIALARSAEIVVVCPATANTLNRMAAGLADDLTGALLLAYDWRKPLLVAPAMNPAMWAHPATQAAAQKLEEWGARFIPVGEGRTACGESGEGRLAEPDAIVAAIESALAPKGGGLRVLVTSGGTAEPIDGVRMITNVSTGHTGAVLADRLARAGHQVVLLRAASAVSPTHRQADEETFVTFAELEQAVQRGLNEADFDVVVHAAAVSDFAVDSIEVDGMTVLPGRVKLNSDAAPVLRLRRNPKLLARLRTWSRHAHVRVVAFKLTSGANEAEVRDAVTHLLEEGDADLVVHNDISRRTSRGEFPADIWFPDGRTLPCSDRAALAETLVQVLTETSSRVAPEPRGPDRSGGG